MSNEEKAKLYDDLLRQSELIQREISKLKAEFPITMPADKQAVIDDHNKTMGVLMKKLEDLYRQG